MDDPALAVLYIRLTASIVFLSMTNMPSTVTPIGSPFRRFTNMFIWQPAVKKQHFIVICVGECGNSSSELLVAVSYFTLVINDTITSFNLLLLSREDLAHSLLLERLQVTQSPLLGADVCSCKVEDNCMSRVPSLCVFDTSRIPSVFSIQNKKIYAYLCGTSRGSPHLLWPLTRWGLDPIKL